MLMIKCEVFDHSTYNVVLSIGAKVKFSVDTFKIDIIEEIFRVIIFLENVMCI